MVMYWLGWGSTDLGFFVYVNCRDKRERERERVSLPPKSFKKDHTHTHTHTNTRTHTHTNIQYSYTHTHTHIHALFCFFLLLICVCSDWKKKVTFTCIPSADSVCLGGVWKGDRCASTGRPHQTGTAVQRIPEPAWPVQEEGQGQRSGSLRGPGALGVPAKAAAAGSDGESRMSMKLVRPAGSYCMSRDQPDLIMSSWGSDRESRSSMSLLCPVGSDHEIKNSMTFIMSSWLWMQVQGQHDLMECPAGPDSESRISVTLLCPSGSDHKSIVSIILIFMSSWARPWVPR